MSQLKNYPALLATSVLFGCAAQQPLRATPSGNPETTVTGKSASDLKNVIANQCLNAKFTVPEVQNSLVVCKRTITDGSAILIQAALGNSYSGPPIETVNFNIVELDQQVRVVASGNVGVTMPSGQTNTMDLPVVEKNNIQRFLDRL